MVDTANMRQVSDRMMDAIRAMETLQIGGHQMLFDLHVGAGYLLEAAAELDKLRPKDA